MTCGNRALWLIATRGSEEEEIVHFLIVPHKEAEIQFKNRFKFVFKFNAINSSEVGSLNYLNRRNISGQSCSQGFFRRVNEQFIKINRFPCCKIYRNNMFWILDLGGREIAKQIWTGCTLSSLRVILISIKKIIAFL